MSEVSDYIKRLEQWLEAQKNELYNEIEEIENSEEPDVLASEMTEVELIDYRIEIIDDVLSILTTLK